MGFNILFHGLVCHRTEVNTSVFIDAEKHELRLVVLNDIVVDTKGFAADPADAALHLNPRVAAHLQTSYRVEGVLTVDGAEPVAPTFTSYFRRFVPGLRTTSSCLATNVRKDVRDQKIVPGLVRGYLVHPGGEYSVNDFFPEKQTMTEFVKDANCMARTIRLALATNGKNITIRDGASFITLKPNAEVRFVNILPPLVASPSNGHFEHYYHAMYEGCNSGRVPLPVGGLQCTHRHDPSFAVPGGDCGNSGDP